MARSTFVHVTYIRTHPAKLWAVLTDDGESMKRYCFGVYCESQWKPVENSEISYLHGRMHCEWFRNT